MSLHKTVVGGAFWSLIGQFGFMLVGLCTNIILARLLTPFEFGQMSILMFFILIASVFTEGGLGGALVRKKEVTDEDYSTAFVFNLAVSLFFFILFIFISGPVSKYYQDKELQNLLIASSFILLIGSVNFTQNTRFIRELKFKKIALIQLISITISSLVSIYLATVGIGIWSLLLFQIITPLLITVFQLILGGKFYPIRFKKESFKQLYAFGVNTSLTSVISIAFDNIYSAVLGRYFSINQAGFFYQAKRLQDVPLKVFSNMVHGVVFSSLAKIQDERVRFINAFSKVSLILTILIGGIFSFIFLYAESIIWLLYGEKWQGAVFFMKLLCVGSFFYFQEHLNMVIFKVFNKTSKILHLEIMKKSIQCISIGLGIYFLSILYLIYGFVASSVIGYLINYYYSRKVLGTINLSELLVMAKVVTTCAFCVVTCELLIDAIGVGYVGSLGFVPVFVILFLGGLKLLNVINLKEEFRSLFKLKSGSINI